MSRAAAATVASTRVERLEASPMGNQTAALTAALTEAMVAALQPLLQRTPWGDLLITEDSDQGGWVRDRAHYYGEEYFWLPPGQTPRQWREECRQMREEQQLYAEKVQPQPEPVVAAATVAAAVLVATALAARGGIGDIVRTGAQPGQAAATAEWPELTATCVPPAHDALPGRAEPEGPGRAVASGRVERSRCWLRRPRRQRPRQHWQQQQPLPCLGHNTGGGTGSRRHPVLRGVDGGSGLGLIEHGAMVCPPWTCGA